MLLQTILFQVALIRNIGNKLCGVSSLRASAASQASLNAQHKVKELMCGDIVRKQQMDPQEYTEEHRVARELCCRWTAEAFVTMVKI